jgi:rhodanese-related sulfurtransferase
MVREALQSVREIEPDEIKGLDGWTLIDVREPDEFVAGHPPGFRSVPRGILEVRADLEHPKRDPSLADRSQRVALICGSGVRSALAARALQEMGFVDPVSVRGGFTAYCKAGLPVEQGG